MHGTVPVKCWELMREWDARGLQGEAEQVIHELHVLVVAEKHDAIAWEKKRWGGKIGAGEGGGGGRERRKREEEEGATAANPGQKVSFCLQAHYRERSHRREHDHAIVVSPKHAVVERGDEGERGAGAGMTTATRVRIAGKILAHGGLAHVCERVQLHGVVEFLDVEGQLHRVKSLGGGIYNAQRC